MTRWVTILIAANAAVFLWTWTHPELVQALALFPPLVLAEPWTVVTYMFTHAGWEHIAFNMLGLYFLGPRVEARMGGRGFLGLYFAGGIAGAVASIVMTPSVAVVGASAAVFAVYLAYAMFWPHDRLYIWGILPMPAIVLVLLLTALSVFGAVTTNMFEPGVAHWGHLGGFAGGWIYLTLRKRLSPAARFRARAAATPPAPSVVTLDARLARWRTIDRDRLHPVNREELDRILAKLAAAGVTALSGDERAFLDRFSRPS